MLEMPPAPRLCLVAGTFSDGAYVTEPHVASALFDVDKSAIISHFSHVTTRPERRLHSERGLSIFESAELAP